MSNYNANYRAILKPITKETVQNMEDVSCNQKYQDLAYAIIRSGYKNKDEEFLKSEWCDTLRYFCSLKLRGFDKDCYVENRSSFK